LIHRPRLEQNRDIQVQGCRQIDKEGILSAVLAHWVNVLVGGSSPCEWKYDVGNSFVVLASTIVLFSGYRIK
jgi:hypothetical protein